MSGRTTQTVRIADLGPTGCDERLPILIGIKPLRLRDQRDRRILEGDPKRARSIPADCETSKIFFQHESTPIMRGSQATFTQLPLAAWRFGLGVWVFYSNVGSISNGVVTQTLVRERTANDVLTKFVGLFEEKRRRRPPELMDGFWKSYISEPLIID